MVGNGHPNLFHAATITANEKCLLEQPSVIYTASKHSKKRL